MSDLVIFGICVLIGALFRPVYRLTTLLEKKTHLIGVTFVLDFALCALLFCAYFAVLYFLCDGRILAYTFLGIAVGFMAVRIFY